MSRAFVKEPDGDQFVDEQPELPISRHPNYVTENGLAQLNARYREKALLRDALMQDNAEKQQQLSISQLDRELRYLHSRVETAEVIKTDTCTDKIVSFGATVTIVSFEENEGSGKEVTQTFTIVGEDEADISEGKISWVSPLAKALLDRSLGDEVTWQRPMGDLEIEIVSICYS